VVDGRIGAEVGDQSAPFVGAGGDDPGMRGLGQLVHLGAGDEHALSRLEVGAVLVLPGVVVSGRGSPEGRAGGLEAPGSALREMRRFCLLSGLPGVGSDGLFR
jgi:hypothetical protein